MKKVDVTINLHMTVEAKDDDTAYDAADDAATSIYDWAVQFFTAHEQYDGSKIEVAGVDMEES